MDEVLFPRGKKNKSTIEKRPRSENEKEDGDLFKHDAKKRKTNDKQNKSKQETSSKEMATTVEFKKSSTSLINSQSIMEETLILGVVQKIKKYQVVISLPNSLSGHVSVTDISDPYTDQLKSFSENINSRDDKNNPSSLKDMFKVGNYVICKVKDVKLRPGKKSYVTLTLKPSELYRDLSFSFLQKEMLIMAAVKSIEDHGYTMDIGLSGLNAFLMKKLVSSKKNLLIGQLVLCAITKINEISPGVIRSVNLTAVPNQVSKVFMEKDNAPYAEMLPGTLLSIQIVKMGVNGAIGNFGQRQVVVNSANFSEPYRSHGFYNFQQKVKGRILYTHPLTKTIHLSFQTSHLHLDCENPFGGLRYGDFVEDAIVEKSKSSMAIFAVNKFCKGILKKSNSCCEEEEEFKEIFQIGSLHRCRIMKLSMIDNLVQFSLTPDFQNKEILHIEDIVPGDKLKGVVKKQQKNGISVTIGENTRGFIPLLYESDNSQGDLRKKYKPGQILSCVVLKSDYEKKLIILSHKSSMVSNKLPIISSFNDASPGMETQGCVAKIIETGYLIAFHNNYKGFAPKTDWTNKAQIKVGDIVKCFVEKCFPQTNRILLSLEISDKIVDSSTLNAQDFQIGAIVSGKVIVKSVDGFTVELTTNGFNAFLPLSQLSDFPFNSQSLAKVYQKGDIIEEMLCLSIYPKPIVTLRKSFINWAQTQDLCTTKESLKLGMLVPLFIDEIHKIGAFVKGMGNIDGLIHISKISGKYLLNMEESKLNLNQTVIGKVIDFKENNKIAFSMQINDCILPNASMSYEMLKGYVQEQLLIKSKLFDTNKVQQIRSFSQGFVINFTVTNSENGSYTGTIPNHEINCLVPKENVGDAALKKDDLNEAVILDVDVKNNCLILSTDKEDIQDFQKISTNNESFLDKVIPCRRLLINDNFIMGMANFKGLKTIAYVTSKTHPNQIGNDEKYLDSCPKEFFVKVKSVHEEFVFAKLVKMNDPRLVHKFKKNKRTFQPFIAPSNVEDNLKELKKFSNERLINKQVASFVISKPRVKTPVKTKRKKPNKFKAAKTTQVKVIKKVATLKKKKIKKNSNSKKDSNAIEIKK